MAEQTPPVVLDFQREHTREDEDNALLAEQTLPVVIGCPRDHTQEDEDEDEDEEGRGLVHDRLAGHMDVGSGNGAGDQHSDDELECRVRDCVLLLGMAVLGGAVLAVTVFSTTVARPLRERAATSYWSATPLVGSARSSATSSWSAVPLVGSIWPSARPLSCTKSATVICNDTLGNSTEKVILLNSKYPGNLVEMDGEIIPNCPAKCKLSHRADSLHDADAIVWNTRWMTPIAQPPPVLSKPACQKWIFNHFYEPPIYLGATAESYSETVRLQCGMDWTMTFKAGSDFFQPMYRIGPHESSLPSPRRASDYSNSGSSSSSSSLSSSRKMGRKTDLLVWVVSSCQEDRLGYFRRLQSYLPEKTTQIYGKCGKKMPCPRNAKRLEDPNPCEEDFFGRFKFYAAFENSRCTGYITEKFARALRFGMVPVAVGGKSRADYEAIAPRESFIHVDDFKSTRALAAHLLMLDQDDEAYNRMFAWRSRFSLWPTAQNTLQPFCELCQELHKPRDQQKPSIGDKLVPWWYDNTCG